MCFFVLSSFQHVHPESKALEEFWESAKHTEWFQHHPILSAADPCSGIVGIALVCGLCGLSNLYEGFIM